MYALGSLLIGALVFGYLLSSVGSLMSNLDNRSNMVEAKLDQMQEVILHTNLPAQLASRVRSYTEFYYSKQSVYDVEQVLQHLTPALEREVKDGEPHTRGAHGSPCIRCAQHAHDAAAPHRARCRSRSSSCRSPSMGSRSCGCTRSPSSSG